MAKTRSQNLHSTIKKEECEDKSKLNQMLQSTKNKRNNRNRRSRVKKPKTEPVPTRIATVKSENATENNLVSTLPIKTSISSKITYEQIVTVIDYIVKDKMSVTAASVKAGISQMTAQRYYQEYLDDPEHKIPLPKVRLNNQSTRVTQQKVEDLIHYITNEKMTVTQAAFKVKIDRGTAAKYYAKYKKGPKHQIPELVVLTGGSSKRYTQEQINDLIRYITKDNMTLVAAAKKVNMGRHTAIRYYDKYLKHPNHEIPMAQTLSKGRGKRCTNDTIQKVIQYIAKDGMTLREVSVKLGIAQSTASKYYRKYLEDPVSSINPSKATPIQGADKQLTLDQAKTFFSAMIIDKLNIAQASRNADISATAGFNYYRRYLKDSTKEARTIDRSYSVEKMKKMLEYIQKDKMAVTAAAKMVKMNHNTAIKFYNQYMNDPQHKIPKLQRAQYTQEDVKRLIRYIEKDNMSIGAASRKAGMRNTAAYNYYTAYRKDPEHKVPIPTINGESRRLRSFDKYSKVVADIYKTIALVHPVVRENHPSSTDSTYVKQEPLETKDELNQLL